MENKQHFATVLKIILRISHCIKQMIISWFCFGLLCKEAKPDNPYNLMVIFKAEESAYPKVLIPASRIYCFLTSLFNQFNKK